PGGQVYYSLTHKADNVRLRVLDYTGKTVRELPVKKEPGLHRVAWELGGGGPRGGRGAGGGPGGRVGQRPAGAGPPGPGPRLLSSIPSLVLAMSRAAAPAPVAPGMYRVVLTVDGKEHTQSIRVEPDPTLPATILTAEGEGGEDEEEGHSPRIDD